MAMARETLSPLIRSVEARRLSLELCTKIGNQLLSPSRAQPSSAGQSLLAEASPFAKNANSSNSPLKWSPHWMGSSVGTGSAIPYRSPNRRGSLGCSSPLSSLGNASSKRIGNLMEKRRGSLNLNTVSSSTSSLLQQPLLFQFQVPSIHVENVASRESIP